MERMMPFNPKSLKNLNGSWTTESAREAQKKGVATRKANKEARDAVKMSMAEWRLYKNDILDVNDMTSVDVLKIMMFKALEKDDTDQALDIAKTLAEFEAPKLARVDQTNVEIQAEDLTDAELEELLDQASVNTDAQRH
tara:strand:+ start:4321 stop:4737 length:417 start_codon:yes stop_codon:yes gene_type:complete